jgi:dimethylargininase
MFTNVIVKKPCKAMVEGITSAPELGKPDYKKACRQHEDYIAALKACGVKVTVLEADEKFPDSCFVEDTAVLTKNCAIISNPGASTRNREVESMIPVIKKFYSEDKIEYIKSPGTMEGGDIMMVGNHFYIGLSARTNQEGADQFIALLEKHGHTGSVVKLEKVLHLKTGVNYIENNNMLACGEFIDKEDFKKFNKIIIPEKEAYAANCIWVNDTVIVPEGYPTVKKAIEDAGYKVLTVDTSEYKKLDGGLSCLSLRF